MIALDDSPARARLQISACCSWLNHFLPTRTLPVDRPVLAYPTSQCVDRLRTRHVLRCRAVGSPELSIGVSGGLDSEDVGAVGDPDGVTVGEDRQKITDPKATVAVTDSLIVRVGKRNVVRVRLR